MISPIYFKYPNKISNSSVNLADIGEINTDEHVSIELGSLSMCPSV